MKQLMGTTRVITLLLAASLLAVPALARKVKLKNVSVENQNGNVLRKTVQFSSQTQGKVSVHWWETGTDENKGRHTDDLAWADTNRVVLNYLKANTTYSWSVHVLVGDGVVDVSKAQTFTTDALPDDLPKLTSTPTDKLAKGLPFEDYVLANVRSSPALLYIFDAAGSIVWYEYMGKHVRPVTITPNNTLLTIRDKRTIVELNTLGEILWETNIPGNEGDTHLHHDVVTDGKGNYYTLGTIKKKVLVNNNGRTEGIEIGTDRIMQFNREGLLLWDWSLFDELDAATDPRALELKGDWGHANGLAIGAEGMLAVSFRTLDEVWLLNPYDKRVEWKLGKQGNVVPPAHGQFLKQHAPHFLPNGDLMVFDNGEPNVREQSRVVTLKLNPLQGSASVVHAINIPQYLSSGKRGSAYPVNERQYLVCSTATSSFFVINRNEGITWRIQSDKAAYRALPLENLP